jgi:diguanylate cyclase (GGDEF)-like protein
MDEASKTLASREENDGHIDRLTSVANRSFFYDKLANLLNASSTADVVVIKIDVARFHEINACYGYEIGDVLLIQVAERLSKLPGGIVGRLAADEFSLAFGVTGLGDSKSILSKLLAALQPRFAVSGATIAVRFAVGFTLGARGVDPMTLMRQAGVALQESRRSRSLEVCGFDSLIDERLKRRVQLTHELHQAVTNEEFVLHYQPKVDLESEKIIGAEALVRWCHPVFGLQLPELFIPIAEVTGLISDLGTWVLREAARFAVRVNQGRSVPLTISVNVSPIQFKDRDMRELVATVLDETGAEPSWLILELTESVIADRTPELIATFQRLRELGLGLSIDDFGTGYSSLRYLERFPISEIKLDKGFVQDLPQSRTKQVIVDAVIKLGIGLDISITAEGVETEAELATLREFGCRYAQGFLFGRPTAAAEFLLLIGEPKDADVIVIPCCQVVHAAVKRSLIQKERSIMKSPNPTDRHVGGRVRSRRIALGMSPKNLADALGTTVQKVQQWEAGTSRTGSARLLELTKILGVNSAFFFADSEPNETIGEA